MAIRGQTIERLKETRPITIHDASAHNLKGLTFSIPSPSLTVISGPSGSGKTSLLFDVIVAELERSALPLFLSPEERQRLRRAHAASGTRGAGNSRIEGASFVVAPARKRGSGSPLETVGTRLQIDEQLAVLCTLGGARRCGSCGGAVAHASIAAMMEKVATLGPSGLLYVLAPMPRADSAEQWKRLGKKGFVRARVDGANVRLDMDPDDAGLVSDSTLELFVDAISLASRESVGRVRGAIEIALAEGDGSVRFVNADESGIEIADFCLYGTPACVECGTPAPPLRTHNLRHSHPSGRCMECKGTGLIRTVSETQLVTDANRAFSRGGLLPWSRRSLAPLRRLFGEELSRLGIGLGEKWNEVAEEMRSALLERFGSIVRSAHRMERRLSGVVDSEVCRRCGGSRLGPYADGVLLHGRSLRELSTLSLVELERAIGDELGGDGENERTGAGEQLGKIRRELRARLRAAIDLGLGYLEQQRGFESLSRGERERLGIAEVLAATLSGVLIALDEPTAGLHPDDTARLLGNLRNAVTRGSTVVMVEHDIEMISGSDWVVELGPGGGRQGGELVASLPRELFRLGDTPTARLLKESSDHAPATNPANDAPGWFAIRGIVRRNVSDVDIRFPLGALVVVAGVSGAGKTTIITEVLTPLVTALLLAKEQHRGEIPPEIYQRDIARFGVRSVEGVEQLDRIVDCSELGELGSPRSTVATASGIALVVRELFARTIDARMRGLDERAFSFNSPLGACRRCKGRGAEPAGTEDIPCESCGGGRFDRSVLQARYKGLTIAELYQQTVAELEPLLRAVPRARFAVQRLLALKLGYLTLAQSTLTLSRGEMQRLRLARSIIRSDRASMFIFDEPTIGLHGAEVESLIELFRTLTAEGHTVVVVEHHPQLFRAAEYLIEIGPGAGMEGGRVVAAGRADEIVSHPHSRTAKYLRS